MTRFAWLQARTQTLVVTALLAAIAVTAAVTGIQLSHLYDSLVVHCRSGCDLAASQFLDHDRFLDHALTLLVQFFPAVLGIFWGAPLLARELETGSYRLAWTQSVTRSRWLLTKLALGGLTTVAAVGVLTLTVTWWYRDIDAVGTNPYSVFDVRDIAPIGYAAFAFASGALIGAVVRRVVPAMATTLVVYVFARVATMLWVRPHLLPPLHRVSSLLDAGQFGFMSRNGGTPVLVAKGAAPADAWTLSSAFVTTDGHRASGAQLSAFVRTYCPGIGAPPSGTHIKRAAPPEVFDSCRMHAARTFRLLVTYQPANRYWTFQWLETAVFLVLALAAAGGCYWWVTRRTS